MDEVGHRENGRHKNDQYKAVQAQWMMPQHQLKDNQTIKLLITEREKAIQDRDIAFAEKKSALVERDMAFLQRDAAIAERNNAIIERDNAIAALEYARENCMCGNCATGCPPAPRGAKHIYNHQRQHLQHVHSPPQQSHDALCNQSRESHDALCNQSRETPLLNETFSNSGGSETGMKIGKAKRSRKETKIRASPSKKATKSPRKSKKGGGGDLNKQVTIARTAGEWRGEIGVGGDLNKQVIKHHEWKSQDLGLNQISFDDSTMPVPVCSCTGKYQQCYKWGNGGWQSACCTMTISMYPLPVMPNKRHARVAGRKMSGSAFRKLLSRLAAEGHDLSLPVDLKDHWAKHGTNRYITIR